MMRLFNAISFSILFFLWIYLSPLNCAFDLQLISLDFARFCNFYNVVTERRTDGPMDRQTNGWMDQWMEQWVYNVSFVYKCGRRVLKRWFFNRFCHFYKSVKDRQTDGPTDRRRDRPTDRPTDKPSYRDARTHLKTGNVMKPKLREKKDLKKENKTGLFKKKHTFYQFSFFFLQN